MRNVCLRIHGLALVLVALMGVASEASGQTVQTLIQFTNTWRYDQTGRDLSPAPTLWKTNTYVEDASWQPLSRGLLGFEPDTPAVYTVHAPILTPLTVAASVTSYYFRTTFQFSGSTAGMSLIASNLVDDGCVIYLNGMEAGRIRVAANQNATTLATGGTEGFLEVVNINPALLRQGANLMAVEVHQSSVGSSDVMFGMRLDAIRPTALVITNQPDGDTVAVGDTVTFTVGVSGGPVAYQWQKDGVNLVNGGNISGANSNVLRIINVQLNQAGTYRVIVTNFVTTFLASSPAVLNVVDDTTGPKLISAVIRDTGQTNQIVIQFDETIQTGLVPNSTSTNINNYRVTQCGTANHVIISNATQGASQVQLRVGGPNWNPTNCYYITVNIVADTRGNQINPNSVIPVSFPVTTNLTQMGDAWNYLDCVDAEFCLGPGPAIYTDEQWYRTNYVVTSSWGSGIGILVRESPEIPPILCAGDERGTGISFQNEPTLFRRTFRVPPNTPSNGTMRLRYIVDDGMVLYLNGKEVLRVNVPAGPLTALTRAITSVTQATCVTNASLVVDNLLPGTNWLAVAVCQATEGTPQVDTVFGLEMDLIANRAGVAPTNPPAPYRPRIVQNRVGANHVLSWPATNYGFALRYNTNIVGSTPAQITNWWTNEANWIQVRDQSNPYSNAIPPSTGPRRFYQLFRETRN
jgi:hypothetical protein